MNAKQMQAWNRAIDRAVGRAAKTISTAMDRMVQELPENAAPQTGIEEVVRKLASTQPFLMRLIMEDPNIRESYYAAVAKRPAVPGGAS